MKKFNLTPAVILFALSSVLSFNALADDSLLSWSTSILNHFQNDVWVGDTCVSDLSGLEAKINALSAPSFKKEDLKSEAPALIDNLWKSRLALHDHITPATSDACVKAVRDLSRQFRFLEDFLGEILYSVKPIDPDTTDFSKQPVPIDQQADGYLLQKTSENFDFKPGDLMLARGLSLLSAMIARLGDIPSQFSHVVFLTQDPATQLMQTIESYVGIGVSIYERETALKNENGRFLVLRAKDQTLAKNASIFMRQYVLDHQGKDVIPYDYKLDFKDHSAMSCAEVALFAYEQVSENNSFMMPERESKLDHGLSLLKNLNVKPGDTFTPGDLEEDSRFDIVAEWRDLRLTRDSRLKDAVLTKIYDWMDNDQYELVPSFNSKMAHGIVWDARHTFLWPAVKKLLGISDFSKQVPRDMVATVDLIEQLGNGVLKVLSARDQAHEVATGYPMTYLELYQELETIRAEDQITFHNPKTRKNSLILQDLRANS